ncbi:MAG TPA: hypothetical protein VFS05_10795 [Gemmatimonadaceae bacterium]|nr:hypothetical protein [Gemmatimonadaceae bacterium]
MIQDHSSRMSTHEYFACIDRAARATAPEEVRRLRGDVVQRWRGDPRADDLAEALYAHEERLAGDTPFAIAADATAADEWVPDEHDEMASP